MSQSEVQENSVRREGNHHRQKQSIDRRQGLRGLERSVYTARANRNSLGDRHLSIGIAFVGGCIAVFLLWEFVVQLVKNPNLLPILVAWGILVMVVVLTIVAVQRLSTRMPRHPWPPGCAGTLLRDARKPGSTIPSQSPRFSSHR